MTWTQTGPQQTWFLEFSFDPRDSSIVAGGDDCIGIFRSETGEASSFELVCPDVCSWTLARSPSDPDVLLSGDPYGRGIRRSADAGRTWTTVVPEVGAASVQLCADGVAYAAIRKQSEIHAGKAAGLWRSIDAGMTWERFALAGRDTQAVLACGGLIFAGLAGRFPLDERGLLRSADGGQTWDDVLPGQCVVNVLQVDGLLHAACPGTGVFTSSDAGNTWTMGEQEGGNLTWGVRADDDGTLYSLILIGAANVLISKDRGATWQPTALRGKHAIGLGATGSGTLYAGTYDAGFWRSDDAGASWRSIEAGLTHSYAYSGVTRVGERLFCPVHAGGMSRGGVWWSDDGQTWTPGATPPVGQVGNCYHVAAGHGKLWVANLEPHDERNGIFVSSDNGETWTVGGLSGVGCVSTACFGQAVLAGSRAGLWRSDDAGSTWERSGLDGLYVTHMVNFESTIIASTGGTNWGGGIGSGFWESADDGRTWRQFDVANDRPAYTVARSGGRLYFAHQGGLSGEDGALIIDRSSDNGSCVVADGHTLYYCGSNYGLTQADRGVVWRSSDGGVTWADLQCPVQEVWWLTLDRGRLFASTFGMGLWALDASS